MLKLACVDVFILCYLELILDIEAIKMCNVEVKVTVQFSFSVVIQLTTLINKVPKNAFPFLFIRIVFSLMVKKKKSNLKLETAVSSLNFIDIYE